MTVNYSQLRFRSVASFARGVATLLMLVPALALPLVTGIQDQDSPQEKVDPKVQRQLDQIKSLVDEAGDFFKNLEFPKSGKNIREAQELLIALAKRNDEQIRTLLESDYNRIKKAHELLNKEGQRFTRLKPLEEYKGISFVSQVVPIIVENCGQCHVNQSRGEFSSQNYQALMDAGHIEPGEPKESYLVELMEAGEMPPGRARVEREQIQVISDWIEEGAVFDGSNVETRLDQIKPDPSSGKRKKFR